MPEFKGFQKELRIKLQFSRDELKKIVTCAQSHSSERCRTTTRRGGFLYNMWYPVEDELITYLFSLDELDILVHILRLENSLYKQNNILKFVYGIFNKASFEQVMI